MIATARGTNYPGRVFPRQTLLLVLNAAIDCNLLRFAREAAQSWLAVYPGDLGVQYLLAKILLMEKKRDEAAAVIQNVCELDPEYAEAHELFAQVVADCNEEIYLQELGSAYALGKLIQAKMILPAWSKDLVLARQAMQESRLAQAERLILGVLGQDLRFPLPAVLHLRITARKAEAATIDQLANVYHARWPDCLQFLYYLAEAQLGMGDETGAVNLLHRCVSNDAVGQVAERLWGREHHYRPLWPETLEMEFDLPIPADVGALLGWNSLPVGKAAFVKSAAETEDQPTSRGEIPQPEELTARAFSPEQPQTDKAAEDTVTGSYQQPEPAPPTVAEEPQPENKDANGTADPSEGLMVEMPAKSKIDGGLRQVEKAFARLAKKLNRPGLEQADGRYPVYVIFSTRTGLMNQYGRQTASAIEQEMRRLAEVLRKRPGWGSLVFLPDDRNNAQQLGLNPVEKIDPWSLKLALKDLDESLAKMGTMIGALLIVGGPEVVPFHKLPNPTDDVDAEVASDNPYGTLDTNYFIPEWPVGRLPGEASPDAGLLLEQIRAVFRYHSRYTRRVSWWQQIVEFVQRLGQFKDLLKSKALAKNLFSLGYSAAVWKQSSQMVFKPIGEEKSMLISPPIASGGFKIEHITHSSLGYYNLHGLEDSAEWYGQRDLSSAGAGPDYPVALSARDLVKNGRSPQVVFTEACYGGHVFNKKEGDSIALRFISIGTQAVVGSTCIAYGSVAAPLIGADLLGYQFWKGMREGLTAGEALNQAKVELVQEMTRRQGFLDGEDQKTLISFVLYGDPLAGSMALNAKAKRVLRKRAYPDVKTICDRQDDPKEVRRIPIEVLQEVKRTVEAYLPGLDDADFIISEGHLECAGENHQCPTAQLGLKMPQQNEAADRTVVTVSKQVKYSQKVHHHYARVTLNSKGKPIKLAVSR